MRQRQPIADEGNSLRRLCSSRDVGFLAAREAIRLALASDVPAVSKAGLVVLHLPEDGWVPLVVDVWASLMHGGREPRRVGRTALPEPGDWTAVSQDGRGKLAVEDVERALCAGVPCLIVAVETSWVPPMVTALADVDATLRPLDWRTLRYVAARAAGLPSSRGLDEPPETLLARVTPRLLRLAYRRGGGAEGLLRRVLAAAEASLPPGTPAPEHDGPRGLARVPGLGHALTWGRQLAEDLRAYREGALSWRDVDRGALLAGPPGTGKTTFARALAEEAGVQLVATSYAEWQGAKEGHLGTTLAAMQRAFLKARLAAPCILFVDEMDSLPDRDLVRHDHADYVRSVVNGFLAELDGAVSLEGVVVLGACNNPGVVEPAILRSGRLERVIAVGLPDAAGLAEIMRVHLGVDLEGTDLAAVARRAASLGLTGADIERFVREARRGARVEGVPFRLDHLETAIVGPDLDDRSPAAVWRVAVHEAGHAVVCEALRPGTVEEVSIRRRGGTGGHTRTLPVQDDALTPAVFRDLLIGMMAGRAAEELVLGEPGGGSGLGGRSDLAQATRLAALGAGALGFDGEADLVWQGMPPAGEAIGRWLAVRPGVAGRVRALLAKAAETAHALVEKRRDALVALAEEMMDRRTLSGEEVRSVIQGTLEAPS